MDIMQFLERTWLWPSEMLKDVPEFDLEVVESEREVLFPMLSGAMHRVWRVGVQ